MEPKPRVDDQFKRWVLAQPLKDAGRKDGFRTEPAKELQSLVPSTVTISVQSAEGEKAGPKMCPLHTASPLSILFMSWISPIMTLGNQRALEEDDIWLLPPEDKAPVREPCRRRPTRSQTFACFFISALLPRFQVVNARFQASWRRVLSAGGSLLQAFHRAFGTRWDACSFCCTLFSWPLI